MPKRSRLPKSAGSLPHHPHFHHHLSRELHNLSHATGHSFSVLHDKFMCSYEAMPMNKRYAVSQGIGMGGLYASLLVAGILFGVPIVGAATGVPMVAAVAGKDIYARRQEKKAAEYVKS
jgi:hypothetical protein